jgi:RecG-like helicase
MAKKTPKEKLSLLRSIGVDPYPGRSRGKLNHDQKSYVARLWRKYHEVADAPKTEFSNVRTTREDVVRKARGAGYRTYKDRVFLANQGYRKSRITKAGNIEREYDASKSATEYLVSRRDMPKLVDQLRRRGLKPYEQITAKFGGSSAFKTVYQNLADLERYIRNFIPRALKDRITDLNRRRNAGEVNAKQYDKERAKITRRIEREKSDLVQSLSIVKIHDAGFVTDAPTQGRRKTRRRNRR